MKFRGELSRKQKFVLLAFGPVYFMIAGLFFQPLPEIAAGILTLIREPDFLITDYFVVGGVGAAFFNAGILTLICIWLVYRLGLPFDGHTVTSACLMFGFSLFGKNLMNIWLILLGVFLYAWYHRVSPGQYIYVGLYGTSLSPIITQVMTIEGWPFIARFLLSLFTGVTIGFVLPPLATRTHDAHKGYSLYNVGFAGGIIATVIVSVFKSFGFTVETRLIWSTGRNQVFLQLLLALFGLMALSAVFFDPKLFQHYGEIIKTSGKGVDYVKSVGGAATMFNMGINGIAVSLFLAAVGADFNGPVIGGIFTVLGFSATGKHVRNLLPVMFGVYFASFAKMWSITDPSPTLALLFSTTLAPVAGEFGILIGMLAGFLHSSVALNVGVVYGGMNLYNNGFAGGLVAMFLVPVAQSVRDHIARARGGLSL